MMALITVLASDLERLRGPMVLLGKVWRLICAMNRSALHCTSAFSLIK
jgi:hypothetical protein